MMPSENSVFDSTEGVSFQDGWPCFREHSLMEAAVTEATREIQVAREMAMMCAFGAMATACQGHVNVQMPTGHKVPCSLMLLTIAESGERKTTTQDHFFQAINELNTTAHQASQIALREHRVDSQLWSTEKRRLERMYMRCAEKEDEAAKSESLKNLSLHIRAEPRPEPSGKFLYEDTTPQALVQMLYENSSNGCLLTSEASSIFSGKALGELDKLNTLWDGGSVIVDRVSREGFMLEDARLTMSLMAQPSVIANFMAKRGEEARGTGFLARFLVTNPRNLAGRRTPGQLSDLSRLKAFNNRVLERMNYRANADRQTLRFSEAATNSWYRYNQYLESQMREHGFYHYLKDHASKLLENTSRLAAVVHTFERTSASDTEIDDLTLQFCWLFTTTCSKHFIENLASEPQLVTDANLLAQYLLKTAYKDTPTTDPQRNRQPSNYESSIPPREHPPINLKVGPRTTFTLSLVKQKGPSSLRGRASDMRLKAAIELLTNLGHIHKVGSRYTFQETILLKEAPALKNGEILTIKELPLFTEQQWWTPKRQRGMSDPSGYYLIADQSPNVGADGN